MKPGNQKAANHRAGNQAVGLAVDLGCLALAGLFGAATIAAIGKALHFIAGLLS